MCKVYNEGRVESTESKSTTLESFPAYQGKKTVNAVQMDKYNFCLKVKNMTIDKIKEEEENQEGYMVVYEDGYKSWSPKNVFEQSYKLCSTPLDRVKIEYDELLKRFNDLTKFLAREDKESIVGSSYSIDLLEDQRKCMRDYINILKKRIFTMECETGSKDECSNLVKKISGQTK